MSPMSPARASALAHWIGEIYPMLNAEQLKLYRDAIARFDAGIVARAVKIYAARNQFPSLPGILEAIGAEISKRKARRESQLKRNDRQAKLARRVEEHLAGLSVVELYELRESAIASYPPSVAERIRRQDPPDPQARRAHLLASQLIRAQVRESLAADEPEDPTIADPPGAPDNRADGSHATPAGRFNRFPDPL